MWRRPRSPTSARLTAEVGDGISSCRHAIPPLVLATVTRLARSAGAEVWLTGGWLRAAALRARRYAGDWDFVLLGAGGGVVAGAIETIGLAAQRLPLGGFRLHVGPNTVDLLIAADLGVHAIDAMLATYDATASGVAVSLTSPGAVAVHPAFFEDIAGRRLRTLTRGLARQVGERRGLSFGKTLRHAITSQLRLEDASELRAAAQLVSSSAAATYYARRTAAELAFFGRAAEAELLGSHFQRGRRPLTPLRWDEVWARASAVVPARWLEDHRAWVVRGLIPVTLRAALTAGDDLDIVVDCSACELRRSVERGRLPWRLNYYGNHKVVLGDPIVATSDIWAFSASRYARDHTLEGVAAGFAFDVEASAFQQRGQQVEFRGPGIDALLRGTIELQREHADRASPRDLAYAAVKGWYFALRFDLDPGVRLRRLWASAPSLGAEHTYIVLRMLSALYAGSSLAGADRVAWLARAKSRASFFERVPKLRASERQVLVRWPDALVSPFFLPA